MQHFLGPILHSLVYVRQGDTEYVFVLNRGSVSIDEQGNVRVLADDVHKQEDLSVATMQEYLEHLVAQMESGDLNDYQIQFLQERRAGIARRD